MVSLVQFARAAPCTKPIMLFSLTAIMISFIFTTVIVTSGKVASSRQFYLVSFEYNLPTAPSSHAKRDDNSTVSAPTTTSAPSTTPSTTLTTSTTIISTPSAVVVNNTAQQAFQSAVQALLTADEINTNMTFSEIRVGYNGVCTQVSSDGSSDSSWRCGDVKSTRSLAAATGGDPFDLIDIGAYYKDKMVFSLPWWFAVACLGCSLLAMMVGSIPFVPVHIMVNRVAAAGAVLGSGSLLVGLILAHVTTNAVTTLTDLLTVNTVTAHVGRMSETFGWVAFALSFISAMGVSLVALGEFALLTAERRGNAMIDHAANKSIDRLPFSSPMQQRSVSGGSNASSKGGLGRTMGGVGLGDLTELAKARNRGEALQSVAGLAGKISTKREKGDNMV